MQTVKDILILAIDTSCDDTSAAVIKNGRQALSNVISSQIATHREFGGVVPELASRAHTENIDFVAEEALRQAGASLSDIDCFAVTYGPGLVGALLTGLLFAKTLALALSKPFLGVNHIEGHICSNFVETDFAPPFVCLVVSGGHTNLVHVKDYMSYEVLGSTRDDAAGEAFDKIARVLGLSYPGGPQLERLARLGSGKAVEFPRANIPGSAYDFSFSGVKSAVINYLEKCRRQGVSISNADIAASFQDAVLSVLCDKAFAALEAVGVKRLAVSGGVASNGELRRRIEEGCAERGVSLNIPKPVFCTDNAAMIGAAAYFRYVNGERSVLDLNAAPSLSL